MANRRPGNAKHFVQRLRALTLTEVLVVIVVCAILAALFVDQSTTTRWSIERRIRNWKPTAADRHQPDHSILAADANIVGEWTVRRRFNSTSMIVTEEAPGKFAIEFSTGGCLGRCEFSRTAHFAEGILTLDEPVSEYLPVVYDKLYAIRCDGDDLLLPSAFVRDFEDALFDERAESQNYPREMCVFRRVQSD